MNRPTDRRTERGRRRLRRFASRLLVATLVVAALTGGAAASSGTGAATTQDGSTADSAFVVALEDDGEATVTVRVEFDLTDEADRAAFDSLRENETKQERLESRTEQRFRTVAADASNATGREMAIETVRASFETTDGGDRGVVSLSADWRGFAATDDGQLRVTEPFASGFTADRPVALEFPDGYALAGADPTPSTQTDERAVWDADTSLEGYDATIAPADDGASNDGTDGESQPGPGVVGSLVAIAGAAWLHRRS